VRLLVHDGVHQIAPKLVEAERLPHAAHELEHVLGLRHSGSDLATHSFSRAQRSAHAARAGHSAATLKPPNRS
jgi:hypothetical protein